MAFFDSVSNQSNFVTSFGPDQTQRFGAFARGYASAAAALAEGLLEKPRFADNEAYPIVFLYRHAFELYLKGLYYRAQLILAFRDEKPVRFDALHNHKLVPLADVFQRLCNALFPNDQELSRIASLVRRYALELELIDKGSYSYRYPIDTNGKASTTRNQIVNLRAFHESMKMLLDDLAIVDFGFDLENSRAQQAFEVLQDAERILSSAGDATE